MTNSTNRASKTSERSRARWPLALAAAFAFFLIAAAATTQASSGIVGDFPFSHHFGTVGVEEPNSFSTPIAAAVNADGTGGASPGDLFVADEGGFGSFGRIQQFSAADQFIRLWGPGVVKSGPDNSNETQAVRVDATGGTFKLGFGTDTTADIPSTATKAQVEAALDGLASIGAGGVSVSGGPGNAGGSTPYLVTFDGNSLAGADQPLLKASDGSTPLSGGGASATAYTTRKGGDGFEICRPADGDECTFSHRGSGLGGEPSSPGDIVVDQASGDLYVSDGSGEERGRIEAYSARGQFLRAWGQDVVASGPDDSSGPDEEKSVTVKATGGTFTLGYQRENSAPVESTTALPYNASPETVKAALDNLAEIGGNYSSVTVTGGPGDLTGSTPYLIAFHGSLGGDDLGEVLVSNPNNLTIGSGAKSANVETVANGGGYEVCNSDDACKPGARGQAAGAFGSGGPVLGVAPAGAPNAGDVLVGDLVSGRVQEFTPEGAFVRAFGFDVDATNPSTGFEVCSAESGDTCQAGAKGAKVGQLVLPISVAEDSTGAIYTVEGPIASSTSNYRVQKFTPAGGLTLTPSLFGASEVQSLTVNAAAGQFRLSFEGQSTPNLSFEANASAVESALNALSSINANGGSVGVSGGPGDATGSTPYLVSFDGGPLARTDPPQIVPANGSTPLSGGSGAGANAATVATTTAGGPGGAGPESSPVSVAIGPDDNVFVAKYFPQGFTMCAGSPSPAETRIEELDPSGAVLETSDPCSGVPGRIPSNGYESRLTVNPTTGHAYLDSGSTAGLAGFRVNVFGPPGPPPAVTLEAVSKITATGGTVSGTINPNGPGTEYPETTGTPSSYKTTYRVEYKKASESTWTKYSPDIPIGSGSAAIPFSVGVGGLAPKTPYELKVVAVKPFTATVEETKSFTTAPAPPEIEAVSSSNVTVDSADLHALINPQGTETTYHFEYGTTPAYGSETAETNIGEALSGQAVVDHVEGLQDAVYHFRVVATNAIGTTKSADQTFTFHPPVCPNQTVREQTGAAYLPDCRAYELVSPEDAGGTTLFTGGPQSPYATNPPRLAFVGQLAAIPDSGRNPIDTMGDLYVSTRGAEGWHTRYIGPSSEEAGCVGGRPIVDGTGTPTTIQNDVMADPGLGRIIDWNLGNPVECFNGIQGDAIISDFNTAALGSNAPYLWNANGDLLDRWPTSVADVAGSEANLSCPQDPHIHPYPKGFNGNIPVPYFCSTYVDASKDLNHFVFSTQSGLYGEGGLTAAPGSAYDNDTADNTLKLISKLPGGGPIPQEPGGKAGSEELIQFPAVSADGSHILMGTATKPACKQVDYPRTVTPPLCPIITQPTHLYMRVNDAVTYDVSADYHGIGQAVTYVGSTSDGSKAYFTTDKQMTADDTDESTDLYVWSENGGSPTLTRVSAGEPAPAGNADNCVATWTNNCDVKTYEDSRISTAQGNQGGLGSWDATNPNPGYTDNAIAAKSGDIYFYSPEQLVPGKGAPGKENLYVYREGSVRHVATLEDDPYCIHDLAGGIRGPVCSNGAAGRLQVTPDGRYAAFVTTSNVTAYDSHGFAEMYRYDAETEKVECVSCRPDGSPPADDVLGSEGGRFLTDDGRVFFGTTEPLDPRDTNAGTDQAGQPTGADVYEFVDGRPQLITDGTGTNAGGGQLASASIPGLYGVSADGVDVYFGTFDTLVGQDRNGAQLKFYDARTNGGFPFVPPPAPCAAADECHGPSSAPPAPLASGTGAALGSGGNTHTSHKRKHHKRKQHRHHKRSSQRATGGHHTEGAR